MLAAVRLLLSSLNQLIPVNGTETAPVNFDDAGGNRLNQLIPVNGTETLNT